MDKGCKKIVPLGKERDGQRLMTSFFKRLMQPQQDPKLLRQGGLRDASQPQGTGSRKQARVRLNRDLMENMVKVRALSQNSTDLLERQIEVSGVPVAILMCEGMVNLQLFTQILVRPLTELSLENADGEAVARWVSRETVLSGDQKEFFTYDELFSFLMAGFVVLLIDGVNRGIACGMQGYSFRSVSEPSTEMNITGSREGFVEPIRVNQTMIRRRLRSPSLKFEMYPIGEKSRTDICLVYLTDTADPRMVEEVKRRLGKLSSDILLSQGYLRPYLEGQPFSPCVRKSTRVESGFWWMARPLHWWCPTCLKSIFKAWTTTPTALTMAPLSGC